jgi:hypothetical protein
MNIADIVLTVASGMNKTLTAEQVANIAKEALTFISGKVSTATWAEAGAAGQKAADDVKTADDAERLFREKP